MSEVREHSEIYLAPACHEEHMQREWCEDDVWAPCEECGSKNTSVRYNLGTDFDRVTAERDETQACLDLSIGREDALQALLTAADERVDVLEGFLRSLRGNAIAAMFSPSQLRALDAALKPAQDGGYEA